MKYVIALQKINQAHSTYLKTKIPRTVFPPVVLSHHFQGKAISTASFLTPRGKHCVEMVLLLVLGH
jgi:hypothetical protein